MEGQSSLSSVFETPQKILLFIFGESLNNKGLIINELKYLLSKLSPESKFLKVNSFTNLEGVSFFGLKNLKSKDFKFGNNNSQSNVFALKLEDTFNSRKTILRYKNQYFKSFCWSISGYLSSLCTKVDFVLPTHSFFQEADFFFNLEQRPQNSGFVFKPFSESRSFPLYFSRIFFDFNSKNKNSIKYDSYILELRSNIELFETNKQNIFKNNFKLEVGKFNLILKYPIKSIIEDFFLFNTFLSKNSKILQNCSVHTREISLNFTNFKT